MTETATIIPIAGGKGGVGKSFVTAQLALALARQGYATMACDLDLGNSNLHTLLGLRNEYAGVGDYLRGNYASLSDLVVPGGHANLGFIAGDGRMPFMANITHSQKTALLRELKKLRAQYVLLDLNPGSSYNTLDLFQISDRGLLVTRPEYTAVVGMLVFIKNLVLRALDRALRKDPAVVDALNEIYNQPMGAPPFTVSAFRERLAKSHPDAVRIVDEVCRTIRPRILYNMITSAKDADIFARIDATLAHDLSIECDHFGVVPFDPEVAASLQLPETGTCRVSSTIIEAMDRIAHRVARFWEEKVPGSAERLAERAARLFGVP